ncbi:MAG TPA: phosphotransferase [Candidatus Paceibacterota bacterium]
MDPRHLEQLCREFALGEVVDLDENDQGVLNKNYILRTSRGTYFLKSVRAKQQERISYIAEVEEFFRERSIPAVCMAALPSGERYLKIEDALYTVYPYIANMHVHAYTKGHMRAMGEILGSIHKAGATQVPSRLASSKFSIPEREAVLHELTERRESIRGKQVLEAIDEEFLSYIELKLERIVDCFKEPSLPSDTLVHGDYHDRNILFKGEDIVGVCDWEKALMAPRAYEVARALEIICFGEGQRRVRTEQEMRDSAAVFMRAYNSVYALSSEELRKGIALRLYKLIHSTWIERQYYDLRDSRSNKFIQNEMRLIESDGLLDRIE